jgi:hypothetical protein
VPLDFCANVQTVNADGTWKQPEPKQQQKLDDMQAAFLEHIKNSGELQLSCVMQLHGMAQRLALLPSPPACFFRCMLSRPDTCRYGACH